MAQPIAIDDARFPELAQPMSTRAHLFLADMLKGAEGREVNGALVLRVTPKSGTAYHGSFCDQLAACFQNRGWDCTIEPAGDHTARVTLGSPEDIRKAAKLGAEFPGSDRLAVGGVVLRQAPAGTVERER